MKTGSTPPPLPPVLPEHRNRDEGHGGGFSELPPLARPSTLIAFSMLTASVGLPIAIFLLFHFEAALDDGGINLIEAARIVGWPVGIYVLLMLMMITAFVAFRNAEL